MTVIDWTKPVETDETPPRPVRVLCTDRKVIDTYHVVIVLRMGLDGQESVFASTIEGASNCEFRLRNVAPKPREIWVNESNSGNLYYYSTREAADRNAFSERVRLVRYVEAPDEPAPAPADDGWIPWHGGECPVAPDTMVSIKLRDGYETGPFPPICFDWKHTGTLGAIVAYRLSERGK